MMAFTSRDRQKIVDGYLNETGRNSFVPEEFIDWLKDQPDHEAYEWFYGTDDATAAREWRISLARRMINGLRIVAPVSMAPSEAKVVHVTVREHPAFISPVATRKSGGGYVAFDPNDADSMAELRRQGVTALTSWLERYGAAFEAGGVDVQQVALIISRARGLEKQAA
jgi:hypothetical protein